MAVTGRGVRRAARDSAREGFELANRDVYAPPDRQARDEHGNILLSSTYEVAAAKDAATQLEKAGIRLEYALKLNRSI